MNTIQKGIITLLKSALTGEKLALPEDFVLEAAYPLIKRHHMTSLAYEGVGNCGIRAGHPVMQELFFCYCKAMQVSEGQMKEFGRICGAFDENGIDYMPLKGCNMKPRYPKPELRIMGDADILIRMEQYPRIIHIMEGLGFQARQETDHELVWQSTGLYLELHSRLVPSYNKDFHAYFGDGWQLAKEKNGTRYAMTPEDELVYLFTHFSKHYRDGGIGCRHVADLWVYLRTYPGLDEGYVKAELEKLQLLTFYENIRRLLAVWFEDAPTDDKMDFLTEFIFSSGSWGAIESRVLSGAVRDAKRSLVGANGRLAYIRQCLFPEAKILRDKYTILKKAPWTLPLVWLVRPFYKVLFERKTLKRQKANLDALTTENMQTRKRLLNYVGLDYHF